MGRGDDFSVLCRAAVMGESSAGYTMSHTSQTVQEWWLRKCGTSIPSPLEQWGARFVGGGVGGGGQLPIRR